MKLKILAAAAAALTLGACADLGFGVDIDSGYSAPYIYGDGPFYDGPWYGPRWSYDFPLYSPPVRPPFIGGPGPAYPPQPQPPRPVRPPVNIGGSAGGVTGVPVTVGGRPRPGNGGLPSATVPAPSKGPAGAAGNNARR